MHKEIPTCIPFKRSNRLWSHFLNMPSSEHYTFFFKCLQEVSVNLQASLLWRSELLCNTLQAQHSVKLIFGNKRTYVVSLELFKCIYVQVAI